MMMEYATEAVETELACSLSSILSGKDSLEIGSYVEAILNEESFVSVETGLVKKLSIVFHLAFSHFDEFRQILKKKKRFYLLSKGYTCRFKSEAFASFASIAIRPWW
jgi:hypothetical protein